LQLAFIQLKERLAKEGLFDERQEASSDAAELHRHRHLFNRRRDT
jgi:hypothetical protein